MCSEIQTPLSSNATAFAPILSGIYLNSGGLYPNFRCRLLAVSMK